ncbi:MAG TPA: hypothetical protein VN105_05090, partial [Chitinophaga sp.]|nr:hypothetical protein [Chitinophaga sp.]
ASIALCAGCSKKFGLQNYRQQTSDYTEESNTLNQRSSQDHVRTDVVSSFWLTSDRLQSALTDVTNTNTSSDSCDTSTNSTTSFSQTRCSSSLQ